MQSGNRSWLRVCPVVMLVVLGCLWATSTQASSSVSESPSSLNFGSVNVNASSSPQAFTIMNTGAQKITIGGVESSSSQFKVTGPALPLTVNPGQGASFQVAFQPTAVGTSSGNITVSFNRSLRGTQSVAVSGTGVTTSQTSSPSTPTSPTYLLSASVTSLNLGSVLVGGSNSQSVMLTNTGNSSVSISQAAVSGAGFTAGGFAVPLTLAAGQSASLTITFSPLTAGSITGSVSVLSNATNSPMTIVLSGSGIAQTFQLTPSVTSLNFGNVLVGSTSSAQTVSITNTGNSSVTISQLTAAGTGFTPTGIALPLTLAAGQSALIGATFTPSAAGSSTSSLTLLSTATNSPTTITLSGTGVQPQISIVPTSVAFGSVAVGSSNTQTMTIQNSGTASLSVTQATVNGQGFALSGLALPLSVAPGSSASFTLSFTPTSATDFSGSLSLVSNAPGSPSTVGLSGTGLAQTLQLSASPTLLSFGSTTVGTSTSQVITISNTGNSGVSVSQIAVSGTAYSATGVALPISLSAGQSMSLTVVFAPLTAGSFPGNLSVVSTATNSPLTIALSGSGVQAVSHSVNLTWSSSSSGLAGYNIYRGTMSGGPYAKVNSTLVPTAAYADTTVQSGTTYYYVTTAVDSTGAESMYSNEATAVVP